MPKRATSAPSRAGAGSSCMTAACSARANPDAHNFAIAAEKAGIRGDFPSCGGPRSMAPYRRACGISTAAPRLQEAVVPVITVRAEAGQAAGRCRGQASSLSYKNGAKRSYDAAARVSTCRSRASDMFSLRRDVRNPAGSARQEGRGRRRGEARRPGKRRDRHDHAQAGRQGAGHRHGWPWSLRASSRSRRSTR